MTQRKLFMATARRLVLSLLLLGALDLRADDADVEIEFLLTSIGESPCVFLRNGDAHSAQDAEAHLRMKYRRGKRYAKSAEHFIDRLASASSLSRKPYLMRCGDAQATRTGDWLRARLESYRRRVAGDP